MKLSQQQALDLIEWISSNEGLNRCKTVYDKEGEVIGMSSDEVLDHIYEISHVAGGVCLHRDWEDKALKLYYELKRDGQL